MCRLFYFALRKARDTIACEIEGNIFRSKVEQATAPDQPAKRQSRATADVGEGDPLGKLARETVPGRSQAW